MADYIVDFEQDLVKTAFNTFYNFEADVVNHMSSFVLKLRN